ncbi:MAG: small subunit ribosomal protein S13 [Saprospiraceae bacterium]
MVRISGIDLSNSKKVEYALTDIFGIGLTVSRTILKVSKIDQKKLTSELLDDEIIILRDVIEQNYKVEDDLRREVKQNIIRLAQINSFRGKRHRQNLPVRGQRTRTNSRTPRRIRVL